MQKKKQDNSMEIVIPAYNEEKNIEIVINKSLDWLKKQTEDYRVLVVNDGSKDNTQEILDNLAKKNKHIRVMHHKKNLGIGKSWKTLYKNIEKDIIFTCPADQQFNPNDFSKTIPYIDNADIISIYRKQKKQYSLFRNLLSNLNKVVIKVFFGFEIKDINWVKMYKKDLLNELDLRLNSPLIETEIIAKSKKRNKKILQGPAPHYPRIYGKPSGTNFKQLALTLCELIKLYFIVKIFK